MNRQVRVIVFTVLVGVFGLALNARAGQHAAASAKSHRSATNPCAVPHRYLRMINTGKYRMVGTLFAPHAIFNGPDGKTLVGPRAIGDFFERFMSKFRPTLGIARYYRLGDNCIAEVVNLNKKTGKYLPTAVDHWVVNSQGKAVEFTVYLRPGAPANAKSGPILKSLEK